MTKVIALGIVLVAFVGTAFAQSGGGATTAVGAAAGSAAPGGEPVPPPAQPVSDARKACAAAMNADPAFAASIVKVADEKAALKRDADTVAAHTDAYARVQLNERHVIYAYAAMWIIAAGFVIFLWRRQQALTAEIAGLRRDLDAAADEVKPINKAKL